MKKQILFIQGGGMGAYEEDRKLAASLQDIGGWQMDEFTLDESRVSKHLKAIPNFFYHSRDDDMVPFAHLALHAEKFPQATIREFDGRGHQFIMICLKLPRI